MTIFGLRSKDLFFFFGLDSRFSELAMCQIQSICGKQIGIMCMSGCDNIRHLAASKVATKACHFPISCR